MPEPKHILQHWPLLGRLGLFALLHCACAWLGTRLTPPSDHISAMWPASGVLLASLLLSRRRYWPAISLVAIVLEPFATSQGRVPSVTDFTISAGGALEGLAGAFLMRRLASFRPSLERVRDVLSLLGSSTLLSTTLGATIGVTALAFAGHIPWAHWGRQWRVFWVGDAMGVLLVAPMLLTWTTRGLEGWSRARQLELVAMLLTLLATVHLIFHWAPATTSVFHPVTYVASPFILWATLRFEARGTAAAMLALASVAVTHTLAGTGPFAVGADGQPPTPTESLVFLQSFLAAVGGSGLLMAAALSERRHAQEKAIHLNRELRQSLEELATAQQELVRRERMAALGELSASVAHEVRNPLAVIANSLAALTRLARPPEDSPSSELLHVMGEEVARLDHLVNGLLDFARPLRPRLFRQSLGTVVDGALEASLRSEPLARGVRVVREMDPELPEVPVDAQLLHLALSNLFLNAMQAMPHGGTLRVELGRGEPHQGTPQVRLRITDTGTGMIPEVMARLFEPFFTTRAAGTGLGLAIVRRIVEAHHGQVEVQSTPGQGTAFTVLLPLTAPAHSTATA